MRGNVRTHYLIEKDRGKLCKEHIKKNMNEENGWDQIAEADTVLGPAEGTLREEIMEAFKHLKIGMAHGSSNVYAEMILANGDAGIKVLIDI